MPMRSGSNIMDMGTCTTNMFSIAHPKPSTMCARVGRRRWIFRRLIAGTNGTSASSTVNSVHRASMVPVVSTHIASAGLYVVSTPSHARSAADTSVSFPPGPILAPHAPRLPRAGRRRSFASALASSRR